MYRASLAFHRVNDMWKEIEARRRLLQREIGAVVKDWGGRLPVALVYANTYAVGMASLGFQAIYHLLNLRDDVVCERVFDDERWDDSPPPLSMESQRRLDEFAVLAFSLSFELDYLRAVNLLRRCGMTSIWAEERGDEDPILIAGGPAVSANPMPLAPIFDAFVIGEAEEVIGPLVEVLNAEMGNSARLLERLSRLEGVYVPQVHGRGSRVRRLWLKDVDRFPTRSVLWTPAAEFGFMHLVELARGCRWGCHFCLAGYTSRPWRQRSFPVVMQAIEEGLHHRRRVGLISAAVSDYAHIDALMDELMARKVEVSVSSLRADTLSPKVLDALARSQTRTVTLAPEAGSQRLRDAIGKGISEEDILRSAAMAAERRFTQLKLYFMLGLPGEGEADVDALIELVQRTAGQFPHQIVVNVTPFVPKPHTPFQWLSAPAVDVVKARLERIRQGLRGKRMQVRAESPEWSQVQAVLARGDQRLAPALVGLRRPTLATWRQSLEEQGLEPAEWLRARGYEEALPWDHIDHGVSRRFLQRMAERAEEGKLPAGCPGAGCTACGVCETAGAGEA